MQAIEFETIAKDHKLELPENITDGTHLRVILLIDQEDVKTKSSQIPLRKPSPLLKGTVIRDDLISPACSIEEWNIV